MHKTDTEGLQEKVVHYQALTEKALEKISVKKGLSAREKGIALDFLQMSKNYFSDAKHFKAKGELCTALAAFSYAHAWLDAGVRAKLLDGKNDGKLFTLP